MESLSEDELRAEILKGLPRMHAAHREKLASYFKRDGRAGDLHALIATSPLLRERFAAFLRETPEALDALVPPPRKRSRILPYAVAACAALLAIIPLLAQYQQQRTLASGPSTASFATAPLLAATLHPRAPAHVAVHRRTPPPAHGKRLPQQRQQAQPRHAVRAAAAVSRTPRPLAHHPRRKRRHVARRPDPVSSRARVVVDNYLNDVIHGNIFDAPEASIVGPMAATRVVSVRPSNDRVKVDVTINGPHGKYYEVFYVARDPLRIVDRFYAPER